MIKAHLLMGKLQEKLLNDCEVFPVFFPKPWREIIWDTEDYKKKMKLYALGSKVQMKHPGVVSYNLSNEALNGEIPWLYVIKEKEKIEDLQTLSKQWLLDKIEELNLILEDEKIQNVIDVELKYDASISLKEKINNNKVVEGILAYYYANEIRNLKYYENEVVGTEIKNGKEKKIKEAVLKNKKLKFFHSFSNNFHEVISEPIELKKDYFSFVLCFIYAVDPWDKKKRVIIHPSVRRWHLGKKKKEEKKKKIHLKDSHSLYLKTKYNESVMRFGIENLKIKDKEGKEILIPTFKYEEKKLFDEIMNKEIELKDILENPKNFLQEKDFFIGIPYGENSFGGSHNISSGIEQPMYNAIYEDILNDFKFVEIINPIILDKDEGEQKIYTSKIHQKINEKKGIFRRKYDFNYVEFKGEFEKMNLVIYEDYDEIEKNLKNVIENSFIGFEKINNDLYIITDSNEKKIFLSISKVNKNSMDVLIKENKTSEKNKRREQIIEHIKNENFQNNIFILFEIEDFKNVIGDPKALIKETFSFFNIKSQFIHPIKIQKEDLKSELNKNYLRVEKSLLDILSKSGFVGMMEEFNHNLYGFNFVKFKDNKIPVLSRITKYKKEYNFLSNGDWVSEDAVLKTINELKKKEIKTMLWNEIEQKLIQILSKDKEDKILILPASLRHRHIESIRNDNISEELFLLKRVKKLTVCRYNYMKEVPGYFLYDEEKKETTKTKGIIQLNESVFYSLAQKADTDNEGKYETHFTKKKGNFQRPRLAELLILTNTNYEKIELAKIIHNSRDLALTTNFHSKESCCLYLIDNLKEYL